MANLFQSILNPGQLPVLNANANPTKAYTSSPDGTQYNAVGNVIPGANPAPTITAPIVTPVKSPVVTAAPAVAQYNTYTGQLQNMLANLNQPATNNVTNPGKATVGNTSDAYTQMLDNLSATSSAATKALINSIQAQRANQGARIDAQYANYKNALQSLGIQHNEAQFTPDLLAGHINAAESEHQQKISALNTETNKALMDAEKAQAEGDLGTLKAKMEYIKQLNQEKQDYLKNIAENMGYESKINTEYAGQVYDQLQKLNDADKEAYLHALANKYASQGVSVMGLVKALQEIKTAREKEALDVAAKKATIYNAYNKKATADDIVSNISKSLSQANGSLDQNGFLTNAAFQYILKNSGLSRKEVLNNFASYLWNGDDGKYKSYKLTPAEIKSITGELPQ